MKRLMIYLLFRAGVLGHAEPISELMAELNRVETAHKASEVEIHRRIQQLETKLNKRENDYRDASVGLFVSGILCAIWAQYTRRSAWQWFFFGLMLAPLALIILIVKNADDLKSGRLRFWIHDQDADRQNAT
jgi:hypothetical protein